MARNVKKAAEVQSAAVVKNDVLTYEAIVDSFKTKVSKAKAPVDARIAAQVKLNGSVEGILYILVANGIAVVEPFDYRGADIEIDADADAFASVLAGKKLSPLLSLTVTLRCRATQARQSFSLLLYSDKTKNRVLRHPFL